MKNKSTKHALLASVLSIVMCFAMLIGSTFAWFTDEVKSGVNKIVAGNLDVELYNVKDGEPVTAETKLFKDKDGNDILWEPGVMVYEKLTVKNAGSLALKYRLTLNSNFTVVDEKSLEDVLKVAIVSGEDVDKVGGDRATTLANLTFVKFEEAEQTGVLAAGADGDTYAIVIYWEPSDRDNDYNMAGGVLSVDLGINLVATQAASESDSFGNTYDENASYSNPWNGNTVDTAWFKADQTLFELSKPEELAGLAELVNGGETFEGKTITLTGDISLGDKEWTPIGDLQTPFKGTFNGTGHTVSGIAINKDWNTETIGFFGYVETANISDLKVDGLVVISDPENAIWDAMSNIGGICGTAQSSVIERCTNSIDFDASNVIIGDLKHALVQISGICGLGTNMNVDGGMSSQTYIRNCLNEGNFKLTSTHKVCPISSGITMQSGKFDSLLISVENCINVGDFTVNDNLTGEDATEDCNYLLGGMAWVSDGAMKNCYSTNIAPIADYCDDAFSNEITPAENMAKQSTFVGFDFENVWELTNGKYPTLRK